MYAIRFRPDSVGTRLFLRADGYCDTRPGWAWKAASPRKARRCARLLCLKGFDIVRLA